MLELIIDTTMFYWNYVRRIAVEYRLGIVFCNYYVLYVCILTHLNFLAYFGGKRRFFSFLFIINLS